MRLAEAGWVPFELWATVSECARAEMLVSFWVSSDGVARSGANELLPSATQTPQLMSSFCTGNAPARAGSDSGTSTVSQGTNRAAVEATKKRIEAPNVTSPMPRQRWLRRSQACDIPSSPGRGLSRRFLNFTCASQAIQSATSEAHARKIAAVRNSSSPFHTAIPFPKCKGARSPGSGLTRKGPKRRVKREGGRTHIPLLNGAA
jgi:hypothetical protein